MANFCPSLQTRHLTTSHGFLLPHCTINFPHYPSFKSIKFTHPPTQSDTAGSIWIATTFDVLLQYSWCSECEKTLWDLEVKPAHGSSYTVRHPTSMMLSAFKELIKGLLFPFFMSARLIDFRVVTARISQNCNTASEKSSKSAAALQSRGKNISTAVQRALICVPLPRRYWMNKWKTAGCLKNTEVYFQ